MHCTCYSSIADIPASTWNGFFESANPFVKHAFLLALEQSGCVGVETGWRPCHMVLMDDGSPIAVMPLYAKTHSYGEFVFDWGWADAYARHGLEYYPKLLTAIPFSPVAGPRVGLAPGVAVNDVLATLLDAIHELARQRSYSSWHLLFPGLRLQKALLGMQGDGAFLHREAVQFHWFNRGYQDFGDFLASFRSSRRKTLKRERRSVIEAGVSLDRKTGADIGDEDWRGFYHCYKQTYRKRSGHDGYLNSDFFDQLRATMCEQVMLVTARRNGEIVACSLFLFDHKRLYGRYWGALQEISCLHFEACFYQGIEFCIENGLQEFDPGTQGEHKLMRGFEPVKSTSYHWIADTRFRQAIAQFLEHEKQGTDQYQEQAESYLPYRRDNL